MKVFQKGQRKKAKSQNCKILRKTPMLFNVYFYRYDKLCIWCNLL